MEKGLMIKNFNIQLFAATNVTKVANMVNPEVLSDMVSAALPNAIKVSPFAKIDTTLEGVPGNSITIPVFEYIGDAADVAEGESIGADLLTTSTTKVTVKKAGKGVKLTDEAVLSGYGDPVGEAGKQLAMSIASKVDSDVLTALNGGSKTYNGVAGIISYDGIVDAVDVFEEETQTAKVIFIHPKQVSQLRKDPNFLSIDKYPITDGVIMSGVIGRIAGCQVVPTRKVKKNSSVSYVNPIVKLEGEESDGTLPAVSIYLKKGVEVETARDIDTKTTLINADEHYVAAISNQAKVVVATFKQTAGA